MRRAAYSSFLAVLVLVALFWGNCLSCPQLLLQAKADPHSCCHKNKKDTPKCDSAALQNFVKAPAVSTPPPAIAAVIPVGFELEMTAAPAATVEYIPAAPILSLRI